MTNLPLYKDIRLYTFIGVIAFLYIHHFYGYFGHYGFDDIMGYAYYGKIWADGEVFFLNDDFFSYRWGFIGITSLFYALFGMSDESSAIAPSLVLLATVLLIFRILKGHNIKIGVIAVLIYVLDNWTMYYSDKLMPDTMVALMTFVAFAIIYNFRFEQKGKKPVIHAFLMSSVLIIAYITKQSVLLLFPVFLILLIVDFINKRHYSFWIYSTFFCILMGMLYLIIIYWLTGDPLSRFYAVEAGLDDNLGKGRSFSFCNYAIQPWSSLCYRLGFEMLSKFLSTGMMFCIMLTLPAIFSFKFKELAATKTPSSFWTFIFVLSVLSSNFMTTSYKAYLPICPDIRHFLFLVPMAAIVAAPVVYSFAKKTEHRKYFIIISILVLALAIWSEAGNMIWIYTTIFILILLRSLLPDHRYISNSFLIGLFLSALAPIISSMQTANENAYIEQREVIYKFLKNNPHESVVITNVIQKHFGQYFMEFEKNSKTKFYSYSELNLLNFTPDKTVYVLTNGSTRFMSGFDYNDLPKCIKDCYEGKKPESIYEVYESKKVGLYKLTDPSILLSDLNSNKTKE